MNISESAISSFFVHLVAFLLLAAASHYHPAVPPGALMVDLTQMTGKEGQPPTVAPAPREESKGAAVDAPAATEEKEAEQAPPAEIPAQQRTVQETPVESAAPPVPDTQAAGAEKLRQFQMVHTMVYVETAGLSLRTFLARELKTANDETPEGAAAQVKLFYDTDGTLKEVEADGNSDALLALLQKIDWNAVPSPSVYRLPFNGLAMRIVTTSHVPRVSIALF